MNSTTNFELYKFIVEKTNLDKIFEILVEEVLNAIPNDVVSEGMKGTIQGAAKKVIIPVTTGIYKNAFLSVYREEFSDEEFSKLLAYYGPGSALWSFFNTNDFFPWLRKTIRGLTLKRIEGLDLTILSAEEIQELAKIGLFELLDKLPEQVKVDSADYLLSGLCKREASLGDKVTKKGDEAIAKIKINWYKLIEKAGIALPD